MAFIKMRMRTEFIIRNGLDILLLQEVVTEDLYPIYGYTIHINIGTERRGTASDPGFDAFRGHSGLKQHNQSKSHVPLAASSIQQE